MKTKTCINCGKEFETQYNNKTCGAECSETIRNKHNKIAMAKYNQRRKEEKILKSENSDWKKFKKPLTVSEITKKAAEEGLSYGQYVSKYGY